MKIEITDTTIIKHPNSGRYLLQQWNKKWNYKKNYSKIQNFIKSTKTDSPTSDSGATTIRLIGNCFMYIETSSGNMLKGYSLVSNEQILYKLVIKHFFKQIFKFN